MNLADLKLESQTVQIKYKKTVRFHRLLTENLFFILFFVSLKTQNQLNDIEIYTELHLS